MNRNSVRQGQQVVLALLLLTAAVGGMLSLVGARSRQLFVTVNSNLESVAPAGTIFNQLAPQVMQQEVTTANSNLVYRGAPPFSQSAAWAHAQSVAPTETAVEMKLSVHYEDHGEGRIDRVRVPHYEADFKGSYTIENTTDRPQLITLQFPFPQTAGTLSNVYMEADGHEPAVARYKLEGINWSTKFLPNEKKTVTITYQANGLQNYRYALDHTRRLRKFSFVMEVSGLAEVEVPKDCLQPTARKRTEDDSWVVSWVRAGLLTKYDVGIDVPVKPSLYNEWQRLALLCNFAPGLMLLFLLCVYAAAVARGQRSLFLHYPLLGIGFFLYYPMVLYLSLHLPFQKAIFLSTLLVAPLVLHYTGKLVSPGFAGSAGLLFVLLFQPLTAEAMLFPAYRSVLVLAAVFLIVAFFMIAVRPHFIDEGEPDEETAPESVGAEPPADLGMSALPAETASVEPGPVETEETPPAAETADFPTQSESGPDVPAARFCPHCACEVEGHFKFCPACGKDIDVFLACPSCRYEIVRAHGLEFSHCPACGANLSPSEDYSAEDASDCCPSRRSGSP